MPISTARTTAFNICSVRRRTLLPANCCTCNQLDALSAVDRGLTTEMVMGVLRWQSRLDDAIALAAARWLSKLDAEVLIALRLATYQARYLTRIPAHAAVNDRFDLVKRAREH